MISNTTIEQIKQSSKVAEVIGDFIQLKKQGSNLVCNCPFHNESTPSFTIDTVDNFYKCFGCGVGGDAISFLEKYKKWTFQESILYLANKYNIQVEEEGVKKQYTKPIWRNKTELSDKLVKWFEKERKISQKTLQLMRITESEEFMYEHKVKLADRTVKVYKEGIRNTVNFNYFRNNELINIKYRDSIKSFKLFKNGELIFYNIDSLINAKQVYFVEGEIDLLALIECGVMKTGIGVVSVPNGASNLVYLDSAIDLLDKVHENHKNNCLKEDLNKAVFHIAVDNDIAGRKLREELSDRLGKERCDYIEWKDRKDANEVLIKDGIQAVLDCINNPKEFPIVGVFNVSDYSNSIDDMYSNGIDRGVGIGMEQFDKHLRYVRGWITVITGQPSSGKSDWTDQMILGLMVNHGWKAAFYSPENDPFELHFSKIARKSIGKSWWGENKINEQEKNLCKRFLQDKLWIIKPEKDFSLDSIIESVKNLKQQKGIDCFVVDAWNRLDHKYSGNNEAKHVQESLMKLDHFCRSRNIHCFLVAHPTKLELDKRTGEYPVVRMYNISGGAHFRNIAANGISVHRDFKKEITEIYVQKVKFIPYWGEMGKIDMKYDLESGRFNEIVGDNAIMDYSNWITKENRQVKAELPQSNTSDIILNDDLDLPF